MPSRVRTWWLVAASLCGRSRGFVLAVSSSGTARVGWTWLWRSRSRTSPRCVWNLPASTSGYLRTVDEALPGFVQALYITGSVALGAWQPPHSDIDGVVVTSRAAAVDDLATLARLHADMPGRPSFDCSYLDQAAFPVQPVDCPAVPFVVSGEFFADKPCGDLHPVRWLTLQRYGRTVRGPGAADLNIDVASAALQRFNLNNLRTCWQPLAGRVRQFATGHVDRAAALDGELVA